uniref:Uncharacterized protein n=1 Tax=Otus sunia TaxID=257818 RepID=A0A8C8E8W3_9STRI
RSRPKRPRFHPKNLPTAPQIPLVPKSSHFTPKYSLGTLKPPDPGPQKPQISPQKSHPKFPDLTPKICPQHPQVPLVPKSPSFTPKYSLNAPKDPDFTPKSSSTQKPQISPQKSAH